MIHFREHLRTSVIQKDPRRLHLQVEQEELERSVQRAVKAVCLDEPNETKRLWITPTKHITWTWMAPPVCTGKGLPRGHAIHFHVSESECNCFASTMTLGTAKTKPRLILQWQRLAPLTWVSYIPLGRQSGCRVGASPGDIIRMTWAKKSPQQPL